MPNNQKKIVPINYTNREYESIRDDLLQIAERFYPESFQDFSEASFGSLMIDAVAYVGDQLSFYMDYNVNEAFLDTAYQFDNVVRHGRIMGYKYTGRPSTFGTVAVYVMVPASAVALGPDRNYIPILKRGTRFTSETGQSYVLTENINFANSKNPIVIARTDQTSGAPTQFAIKSYGTVVSGFFGSESITIGPYEKFKRVKVSAPNVSEIISVHDSQGNEYYEVNYLAQDMVYKEIGNKNFQDDNVPSILKPYVVARKFTVLHDRSATFLQFGSGQSGQSDIVADPQQVAMDVFGKDYVTDTTFDPTRLSKNENFGIVPSDTTLQITYRVTNPTNANVATGQLNTVSNPKVDFSDRQLLVPDKLASVISSIEVSNEKPITGDVRTPNTDELKQRIFDTFPTQNRAVTQADYENVAYRMPHKFGSIKRCSVQKDADSAKRNLNMYVISENQYGKLVQTNATIKKNLKTWINQYRMINDTIDILDPFIINLGIQFVVKGVSGANKYTLLQRCVKVLKDKYNTCYYIGEPFYISDVYSELKNVDGVLDVVKVKLVNKTGNEYSSVTLDINQNLSPDGSYLAVPKNAVVEIKYPLTDVEGRVR